MSRIIPCQLQSVLRSTVNKFRPGIAAPKSSMATWKPLLIVGHDRPEVREIIYPPSVILENDVVGGKTGTSGGLSAARMHSSGR